MSSRGISALGIHPVGGRLRKVGVCGASTLPPREEAIRREIRQYHEAGVDSIAAFACYPGTDDEELYGEPDISDFAAATAAEPPDR